MKKAQIIASEHGSAFDATNAAENTAIAKDQNWSLGMTKYTFDDNSVLAIRDVETFAFDADSRSSIEAYAAWLGSEIDELETKEVARLLEYFEE